MTTKSDIKNWLTSHDPKNHSHMIVVCDTYNYEDYPVFITKDQDVRKELKQFEIKPMTQIMEVYNLSIDLEAQLNEKRVFNI